MLELQVHVEVKTRAFSASGSLTSVLLECPSRKAHEPQNTTSKKVGCLNKIFSIQYSTACSPPSSPVLLTVTVYLSTLCQPMSSVPGRRHLPSARHGELDFPRVNLATYGDGRLPTPVPHLETLYLTVSRTLISLVLLCKHSNAILRPFYFPHTSTFSVFEVFFTKTRYINALLLLLLLYY